MNIKFSDSNLKILYETGKGKGKYKNLPKSIAGKFVDVVNKMAVFSTITDFWTVPSLRFEKLNNDYYSVRVNIQYRVIFTICPQDGVVIEDCIIDELSKHYGQ